MEEITVRSGDAFIRAGAAFKVPILSWTNEIPSRFFKALYHSLSEILYIQPSDFSAPSGQSLGDCSAVLSIFGGNCSLMLKSSGIIADFPNLGPDRIEWANSVILQGYQAIRSEFDELEISTLETTLGHHFAYSDERRVKEILSSGKPQNQIDLTCNLAGAIVEHGLRFGLIGPDGKWNTRVTVEKSNSVQNGIFLLRETKINNLEGYDTPAQQLALIDQIDLMALEVAGLKTDLMGENAE